MIKDAIALKKINSADFLIELFANGIKNRFVILLQWLITSI